MQRDDPVQSHPAHQMTPDYPHPGVPTASLCVITRPSHPNEAPGAPNPTPHSVAASPTAIATRAPLCRLRSSAPASAAVAASQQEVWGHQPQAQQLMPQGQGIRGQRAPHHLLAQWAAGVALEPGVDARGMVPVACRAGGGGGGWLSGVCRKERVSQVHVMFAAVGARAHVRCAGGGCRISV